ncbi:arginine--tRNA ligase [Halobacillus shinanisalinarum]|uniref:Arginine--tRNA ligase n=1 Tax=Halobacillus shinanisalinarum TaxID=2932258 RepID=A0ABY4GWR2_9BACI|nr:arginine--tRNA ligase [Halobacillus shinanisalinarum]UOQ92484.1 arginine--tRNA ligase [Halobacillus shinanisalinarum]
MEKHVLALQLSHLLGEEYSRDWVHSLIEIPKQEELGDLAFPCFQLAKSFRQPPAKIAGQLAPRLKHDLFASVQPTGGYINIFLNQRFVTEHTLKQLLTSGTDYGSHEFGANKNVVLDMSAPNIAKPFSMGHLRSTVIGNALANLADKCGYETVKINYIGDYGTQFGKLLAAYKKWGNEELVRATPLPELTKIYVKFHEESKQNPSLIEEGRDWFKKLEQNDPEAIELWKWFKDASLTEFNKIYNLLGVSFDLTRGEAYYNDKMDTTVDLLKDKGLLAESDGAKVVPLDKESLPPCLIMKSDGTTIYATRDLTAAIDRYHSYKFDEALYVVGHEQTLHFQQIKHVLKKLNLPWAQDIKHISFGMMLQNGTKMSTRRGKTILLEEVLKEAIERAKANIEEKNPGLADKDLVAKQVGAGAVIFHDLKHDRRNDVEFSLEDMLTFEGDTAPYLQYAYVRAQSILDKGEFKLDKADVSLDDSEAWPLVKQLRHFPDIVEKAYTEYDPSKVARYLLDAAKTFNKYYAGTRILQEDQLDARLTLVHGFSLVIKEGLRLLGIQTPNKM